MAKSKICPTCSCSLVRLGITKEKTAVKSYKGIEYSFCCEGCASMFLENAEQFLKEISDLIVCPTCLGEKPVKQTNKIDYQGKSFYFCRCPHCESLFHKDPEYYIKRMSGEIEFSGIFPEGATCCGE